MRSLLVLILPYMATLCSVVAQPLWDGVDFADGGRSHRFDVVHIDIDISLNDTLKQVAGRVRHRIRSLGAPLRELALDAAEQTSIGSVLCNGMSAGWRLHGEKLDIQLPIPVAWGDTFTIEIDYRVVPKTGLWFILPDSLEPNVRPQIWTQGEAVENHGWVPIYDYPNDRSSSELRVRLRPDWKVLSNGRLLSVNDNPDRTRTWHWMQDEPHASYLIMLAAGDYLVTRDTVDRIPLEYWSYPDMPERVAVTFARTPDIIRYFTRLTGIPYPWQKYAQVVLTKYMYGGMENTGATTLNEYLLVDSRGILDRNPDETISHEIAHQWYGDLVTNRNWRHLWLHESFATYMEARYLGYRYGEEEFDAQIFNDASAAVRQDRRRGRSPIVGGNGATNNLYSRGARVLHMLNRLVGDDLFWRANNRFLAKHAYGLVETGDLRVAFEETTGLDLHWFFDQWLEGSGMPKFDVESVWDAGMLRLRVKQVQALDSLTPLFRMPVPVEFHLCDSVVVDTVFVDSLDETFTFPLVQAPDFVIFDAGDVILKQVTFRRSNEQLIAQLSAPRAVDRIFAVRVLAIVDTAHEDRDAWRGWSDAVRVAWDRETSPWVREEMLDHASDLTPDNTASIIALGLRDSVVSVRRAAIDNIYSITDKPLRAQLVRPLLWDSSYAVSSGALVALAYSDTNGLEPLLRAAKGWGSGRNRFAVSWLSAVKQGGYPSLADSVVEYAGPAYDADTRAMAFSTLAQLNALTPRVLQAIEGGLRAQPTVATFSAAAARKMMNPDIHLMLLRLRGELSVGERRDVVDSLLNVKYN